MIGFLINLAGAVALLLWSVRLVRTGVERGFAVQMRRWLRRSDGRPVLALGTGLVAAMLMQSATAVALLAGGFIAAGTLELGAGLAVLLGADVGSALVVRLLIATPAFVIPLLLLVGVGLFLRAGTRGARQVGRILIGLALIFVALGMIRTATGPVQQLPGMSIVLGYLGDDLLTAFVLGAALAWGAHSSIAAVLLVVTLAQTGALPIQGALALILGANFGSAIIAVTLTLATPRPVRQVIWGNAVMRGGGAALVLVALALGAPFGAWLGDTPRTQAIDLHILFNVAVALIGVLALRPVLALTGRLLPQPVLAPGELARRSALDESLLDRPEQAIASATRELLHMGEQIESMLRSVIHLFDTWSDATAGSIAETEAQVDRMYFDTKMFFARLQGVGDREQAQAAADLTIIAVNLESAGDLIAGNLVGLAKKKHQASVSFSPEGWREIGDFHDRVLANASMSLNVLLTGDADAARQLILEKDQVRDVEAALQTRHLERLRLRHPASLETSNIHQDLLRFLKQINTAFSTVAQPILKDSGDLLSSRLTPSGRAD